MNNKETFLFCPPQHTIWATPCDNVPSNKRNIRSFRSSCLKYHPVFCFPFMYSVVSNDSVTGRRRPWSDCAHAQAVLSLRFPHMLEAVSHSASHMHRERCFRPHAKYGGSYYSVNKYILNSNQGFLFCDWSLRDLCRVRCHWKAILCNSGSSSTCLP